MKRLFSVLLFCLLVAFFSCKDDEPNYPVEPFISLKDISFHQIKDDIDFLEVIINFRDGDKDLGLSADKTPYNTLNFYLDNGDSLEVVGSIEREERTSSYLLQFGTGQSGKLATLKTKSEKGYEFMPEYIYPYSCLNYTDVFPSVYVLTKDKGMIGEETKIVDDDEYSFPNRYSYTEVSDEFYVKRNENGYNFFVEYLVKQSDGSFKKLEWETITGTECGAGFDARFPSITNPKGSQIINGPFTINLKSEYEGEITYLMQSEGIPIVLYKRIIKLRMYIKDRAFHNSNIIETDEFTLEDILKLEEE